MANNTNETTGAHLNALAGDNTVDLMALDTRVHMSKASGCPIINPLTKQPTGAVIWLLGKDSEKVQNYINGEANAQLSKEAERQARGKTAEPPTVEKGVKRSIDLLIVATERWENVSYGGQNNVEFSVANARELYSVPFIREQLNEWIGEIENFMKG